MTKRTEFEKELLMIIYDINGQGDEGVDGKEYLKEIKSLIKENLTETNWGYMGCRDCTKLIRRRFGIKGEK